jgi:hypothetical protein
MIKFTGALSILALGLSVSAATVYQHSGSGNFSYTGGQYGDEVVLAGTDRVLTGFSFEYSANFERAGGLTFSIYNQNGPLIDGYASPGTLLYSTTLDVLIGGRVVNLGFGYDPANLIPDHFTYTVDFGKLAVGELAGLIVPGGSPAIGLSGNDFWEKIGPGANDWALKNFGAGQVANFTATVTAVPEPTTVAMMVGGAGLMLLALRRK